MKKTVKDKLITWYNGVFKCKFGFIQNEGRPRVPVATERVAIATRTGTELNRDFFPVSVSRVPCVC